MRKIILVENLNDSSFENFKKYLSTIFNNYFSYSVHLPDGYFEFLVPPTLSWIHAVMNFIGPDEGQGIMVYNDGKLIGNDTTKFNATNSPSNGRIQIGREDFRYINNPDYTFPFHASVEVDELLIYNRTLTEPEIILLKQNTL